MSQGQKVQHKLILLPDSSIDLATDPNIAALVVHEKKNSTAIKGLNNAGFNGDVFANIHHERVSSWYNK